MLLVRNFNEFNLHPELGPGYHFGRVSEESASKYTEQYYLILNQTIAITAGEICSLDNAKAICAAADSDPDFLDRLPSAKWAVFDLDDSRDHLNEFLAEAGLGTSHFAVEDHQQRLHGSPPFSSATRAGDRFYRFSAFRNDRRIGKSGIVHPGTYATTQSDKALVPNACAAVGRYALPSILAPIHMFEIIPPPGTKLLFGTVLPNFGHAGGGAEVEFVGSLPFGSAVYCGTIPEW